MHLKRTICGTLPAGMLFVLFVIPLIAWLWLHLPWLTQNNIEVFWVFLAVLPEYLAISFISSVVATIIASCLAMLHFISRAKLRIWLTTTMSVPLLIGFLARNYAWLGLLNYFGSALDTTLAYNTAAVVLVMATVFIPFAYFIVIQGMGSIHDNQLEAAVTLGCDEPKVFRAVVFPIALKTALIAWAICFVLALSYFITPTMIGGGKTDFLGNLLLEELHDLGNFQNASHLAILYLITSALPTIPLIYYLSRTKSIFHEFRMN